MLYALTRPAASRSAVAVHDRPRGDYGFAEDLREFICHRLDKVDPFAESREYRRQQEKASRLYEKLQEALTEEGRAMLLAYSEAQGAAHCLEVELLAERAFLDGMRMVMRVMEGKG